jgi:hypothetical protein
MRVSSTPQSVRLTGTDFPVPGTVLVTMPNATVAQVVTPDSNTTTLITFTFTFPYAGTYLVQVADETGNCDSCPSVALDLDADFDACPDGTEDKTLLELVTETAHRLGDDAYAIWTKAELEDYILDGYRILCTKLAVFWDQIYLENLPRGFSVTQPWEVEFLQASGRFNYGVANFTAEFERRAGASIGFDERRRYGPGNHTSPFEATDGLLSRAGASTDIPATVELPKTITFLDRATWDNRNITALEARSMSKMDARYEITKGEVYGYTWQKDGIRTFRKIRVPAAQCDTVTVNGSWGIMRSVGDLNVTAPTGTWGIPRQLEGHQPLGPETFGTPRRVYLEGKNVRVEVFRQGRVSVSETDAIELHPRYAIYLRDFARSQCYGRPGPGYDKLLAQHFDQRWQRDLGRIAARLVMVDPEHTYVLGGEGRTLGTRPPRPSLPWQYGSRVR